VKGHDGTLAQAISGVDKVIGEVNMQAKQVEREIHAACEKVREMVNEREAQLLSEVETVRHEKEKELVGQKHHLEFLLVGIRESTQFGEMLVKEGSESEIVASQKEVVSRLTTLGQETERSLELTDSSVEFERDRGLRQVEEVIKVFGSVMSRDISAEKSLIEGQPSGSVCINQVVSFKVIVIDKKGNRVTSSPKRELSHLLSKSPSMEISSRRKSRRFRGRRENSMFRSLRPLLASTRSLFLTREGISREVRLGLRLLIDLFIIVITTLLEPTLFFKLVPKDQEMASLVTRLVLPVIQGVI